jgi:DNA-binding PadR family transcriptional regulator
MPRKADSSPQTRLLLAALCEAAHEWHYGYDLSRRLGLPSGTLYPILMRLAERGCLEARWLEPERPGRPPRHAYRLTQAGLALAEARLPQEVPSQPRRLATEGINP